MKVMNLKAILVCLGLALSMHSQAQLTNILKGLGGGNSSSQTDRNKVGEGITSILNNLIGTAKLSNSSVKGTWVYESPAVVFESSNLLKKAGGSVVAGKLEDKMQTYLSKIGFVPGKVEITFDGNGKYTMIVGAKKSSGTYKIEGSEVTLTRTGLLSHPVSANMAVVGSQMQMTFKADKLLEFFTKISSLSTNAAISAVSSLAKGYDGMQIGFQMKKK